MADQRSAGVNHMGDSRSTIGVTLDTIAPLCGSMPLYPAPLTVLTAGM